jgi:tetratricopeptide (TPR) repeat protein
MGKKNPANKQPYKKPAQQQNLKHEVKNKTSKSNQSWFTSVRKQYLFLIILAFGLYANTLDLNYALDDTLMITGNKFTLKGVHGIGDIFTNDAFVGFLGKSNLLPGGRYRPLSQVMFAVEYQIFGLNPFIGHLINVLMYIFLIVLLFKILRKLFSEEDKKTWYLSLPFIATALFAAHPLHTEVVANIKGRDDLMSLLGTLGSLYFIIRYTENKKIINLVWTFIIFFLAILSKENALAFFVIIPLILIFFKKGNAKAIGFSVIPLGIAIMFYVILRAATIGFIMKDVSNTELLNNPFMDATFAQKYATIFYTWGKYFLLLIFPHPLTHDYYPKQIPLIGFLDYRAIIPLLLTLAMGVYAIMKISKRHILSFAILFFWLSFAMSSNLVINIGTFMNERFMFAPLLGFTLVLAWLMSDRLLVWFPKQNKWRGIALTILIVLLAGYSLKTMTRNRVWKNDLVLFTTDVETSTNSAKCNTSAGGKLLEWADSTSNPVERQDYLTRSVKYLNKAIEIYPTNINSWLLLGNAYIKLKDYPKARDCFNNCLRISPGHPASLNNLLHIAQVSNRDKLYEESIITYRELLQLQPDSARNYFGIGLAYKNAGQMDSAVFWFNRTLAKDPRYGDAWGKLGEIYGQYANDLVSSEKYLNKAIECNPRDASALENLGIIYAIKKNFPVSLEYFNKALAIDPDNAALNRNTAQTYQNMGNTQKANEYFAKANQLDAAGKGKKE